MNIRELYNEAVMEKQYSLLLFLDFLLFEKQVITFKDDQSVLDLYFMDKHKDRMNKLLGEYKNKNSWIS